MQTKGNVMMTEQQWDKKLKINTIGREDSHADDFHFPYEPTPYSVLERLVESEYIGSENVVIDYGCGKGRVDFYLAHAIGCQSIGVEFDEKIYEAAVQNHKNFIKRQTVRFVRGCAEEFEVEDADRFFFFNPFSIEILRKVMGRILDSYYENPREMYLFFYYINDEYLSYLMTAEEVLFEDEIDCKDLFEGENEREKILIFSIMG